VTQYSGVLNGVELRVDLLESSERRSITTFPDAVRTVVPGIHTICTVRKRSDGGAWDGPEPERLLLLRSAAESAFDYIDLEGDLPDDEAVRGVANAAAGGNTRIIWSLHDFDGVPDELSSRLLSLVRTPDGVPKAAVMPRSTADLGRILAEARKVNDTEKIVIGMGEFGMPTRLIPQAFGSMLTFASSAGAEAAPGHVSPDILSEVYRVGEQRPGWPVFGVIGNPIAHSKSPHYHNARFEEEAIAAVYVPFLVDSVEAFFEFAEALPVLGFSVTIPHKQAVLSFLEETSPEVKASQACNTVVTTVGGRLGVSTDTVGFMAPLEELAGGGLAGTTALVLGAGGASRGIVYALVMAGVDVLLWNRTESKAHKLATQISEVIASEGTALYGSIEVVTRATVESRDRPSSIVVNTTSVGMHGDGDPAPWLDLQGNEIVYDIVYTPPATPLIQRALGAGCKVITGDRMFEAQAAAQYALYKALATDGA
jgi:3-dehydroquinate dehydratase/shikimate dehydrogenase